MGGDEPLGEEPEDDGFLGERQHTLDAKGRVILPAAYRQQLGRGLVIAAWLDHCLTVLPKARWREMVKSMRNMSYTDAAQRQFVRMMMSSAHPDALDKQGRVTIPTRLREFAHLDREVAVVGADDHVELWDSTRWEEYRGPGLDQFANTNQSFDLGGIF